MKKRNRLVYLLLLFLSLFFVYFYGGKIPYATFYTALSLPVFSFLYTLVIFLRFKYVQTVEKKYVTKGESVSFQFTVSNEDIFLYPYIRVTFCSSDTLFKDQFVQRCFSLPPFSKKSFELKLECKYRGSYDIGIKTVEIEDFLGIFTFKYNISETKNILVFPRIVPIDRFELMTDFLSETHTVLHTHHEDMSTISDIRKYAYGDSLKKIHWKLTAKTGDIKVKEFQSTSETNATIVLDLKRNFYSMDQNVILEDMLIEYAVSVLHYCLSNWIPVNLLFYSDRIYKLEAKNPLMFREIYTLLSTIRFDGDIEIKDLLNVCLDNAERTNILIFSSNLDYDLYNHLCKAKLSGYDVALLYFSPEEITGVPNKDADRIMDSLPEIGITAFKINLSDQIQHVFGVIPA